MNSLEDQIKLFVGEIVNRASSSSEIKKGVYDYKCFLINTKLISKNSAISKWLDVVINSSGLIAGFKENDGFVDIVVFVESVKIYNSKKNKVTTDPKHYGHYHSESSSSCSSSETQSTSCGSSRSYVQSSSCGGSYTSTSRC